MEEIRLVKPSMKYDKDIMLFRQEIMEAHDHSTFAGCYGLEQCSTTEEWLNLQKCKDRNMDKVMITCSRDNTASERTILANGGIFEKEVLGDGEYMKRYWIDL